MSGIKKSELVLEVAIPFMVPNENLYSHTEVCQLHRSFIIEEFLERRASAIAREKTKFTMI